MPTLLRPTRLLLAAALLLGSASAANLRLYPSFAEVTQTLSPTAGRSSYEVGFSRAAWALVQPGSLVLSGVGQTELRVRPTDRDWLASQVGQPVTVLRAGQSGLTGTLARADDPLVKLDSGSFLAVQASELVFQNEPPVGWQSGGVLAQFKAGGQSKPATLSYRTGALSWMPRYELAASGSAVNLAALAEIRNRSEEAYSAKDIELYAGEVRNTSGYGQASDAQLQNAQATSGTAGVMPLPAPQPAGVVGAGELRGLQRYALSGSLQLGRGETLSVPFLKPKISAFTRYDSIQTYFDPQARSGSASRHSKFTSDLALPAGPIAVREDGTLVGTVNLPASQPGKAIDLDLGADSGLRYARTVKQLSQEKAANGKIVSTTYRVSFAFTSTRSTAVSVQLREQVYGRALVVDGQVQTGQQISVSRQVDVPANSTASLTFTLKIGAN
jgi:hypothetical protein